MIHLILHLQPLALQDLGHHKERHMPRGFGKKTFEGQAQQIRVAMNAVPPAGSSGDHGLLLGLDDDDHDQYIHLNAPRTITGQHSFTPGSAQAPFLLGPNAQDQVVAGLRADQLTKSAIAGTGMTGGGALTADVTLNVIGGDGITANADEIVIDLATTSGLTLAGAELAVGAGDGIDVLAATVAVDYGTGLAISSEQLIHNTGDFGDMHTNYAEHDQVETITGAWTFSTDLLPTLTDTYDLGSSAKLWRKGYLSELEALLFVENSIHVEGGWFIVGHNQGTIDEDLDVSETAIDFGIPSPGLAVDDFILFRAYLQVEYMKIVSSAGGNIWNVTRNVDGSGADTWPQGSVFLVLGNTGDGRIELVANQSDSPKISMVTQGATYNTQIEYVRLGNMRGSFRVGPNDYWGLGVGDYSGGNYLEYNHNDGFIMEVGAGQVVLDDAGISIEAASGFADRRKYKFVDDLGTVIGWFGSHFATGQSYTTIAADHEGTGFASFEINANGAAGSYGRLALNANNTSDSINFILDADSTPHIVAYGFDNFVIGDAGGGTRHGLVEIRDTTAQLSLWNNSADYATFFVDGSGDLTVVPSGSRVYVTGYFNVTNGLHVGATTAPTDNNIHADNDIRLSGGLTVGNLATNMDPGDMYVAGNIFVNDTQNANQAIGLTINQATGDDEILALKSLGDVAHQATGSTETDTYARFKKVNAYGGLDILGIGGVAGTLYNGLYLKSAASHVTGGKTSSDGAMIMMAGYKNTSGTLGSLGSTNNLMAILDNTSTVFIFEASGDFHINGTKTLQDITDDYDDMALLNGFRAGVLPVEHEFYKRSTEFIKYARPVLEGLGIISYNDGPGEDGQFFVSLPKLQMLTVDAVRQLHDRQMIVNHRLEKQVEEQARAIDFFKRALLEMGIDPEKLQ